MTFREVILSIEGLRERDKMLEGWARRATLIIASSSMGGKSIAAKFNKLWPVEMPEGNVSDRAREQLRIFREGEALERAKQKLKENG